MSTAVSHACRSPLKNRNLLGDVKIAGSVQSNVAYIGYSIGYGTNFGLRQGVEGNLRAKSRAVDVGRVDDGSARVCELDGSRSQPRKLGRKGYADRAGRACRYGTGASVATGRNEIEVGSALRENPGSTECAARSDVIGPASLSGCTEPVKSGRKDIHSQSRGYGIPIAVRQCGS